MPKFMMSTDYILASPNLPFAKEGSVSWSWVLFFDVWVVLLTGRTDLTEKSVHEVPPSTLPLSIKSFLNSTIQDNYECLEQFQSFNFMLG